MPSRSSLFTCFLLLIVMCCSCDRKPGSSTPPAGTGSAKGEAAQQNAGQAAGGSAAFRIEPGEPVRGTDLRLVSASPIPAGANVEWKVNGRVESRGGVAFNTSGLRKGDKIQATVGGSLSAETQVVTLGNSAPEIRGVRFVLGDGPQGNSIGVETETFDADGDAVRVDFEWRKNGEIAGGGNRLEVPVKRGDKIEVTITPHDGEIQGRSATLKREIRNTPPVIEGQEQFKADGSVVTFHVRASDTDGDRLAFALKDAPAGMKIDKDSGWVRWETPSGTTGKVPFTVMASDGAGGEATARFTVTIEAQPPAGAK